MMPRSCVVATLALATACVHLGARDTRALVRSEDGARRGSLELASGGGMPGEYALHGAVSEDGAFVARQTIGGETTCFRGAASPDELSALWDAIEAADPLNARQMPDRDGVPDEGGVGIGIFNDRGQYLWITALDNDLHRSRWGAAVVQPLARLLTPPAAARPEGECPPTIGRTDAQMAALEGVSRRAPAD